MDAWDKAALSAVRWRLHAALRPASSAFRSKGGKRVLLLTEQDPIPQAQVFPFYFFRQALADRMALQVREVPVEAFESDPDSTPAAADVVLVQTWFDWSGDRLSRLFGDIKGRHPDAKIVYLDWFAPTDLRLAQHVDPHVDLYVKKHVLKDRAQYGQPTRGDTNLMDYYGRAFGLDFPQVRHAIPPGFLKKLVVGPSFSTGVGLLPYFFHRSSPVVAARTIDVHARLATAGAGWYHSMRQHAVQVAEALPRFAILSGAGVGHARYMRELSASRSCFSPFGYGEVCWRDFEAIASGALLFKPDMSHIETAPEIFVANQTYVPLRWDLADFQEKLDWWMGRDGDVSRVTRAAYMRVHQFSRGPAVTDHFMSLLG